MKAMQHTNHLQQACFLCVLILSTALLKIYATRSHLPFVIGNGVKCLILIATVVSQVKYQWDV